MSSVWIAFVVIYLIIKIISAAGGGRSRPVQREQFGALTLKLRHSWESLEDGETLELLKATFSGVVAVPYGGMEVSLIYSMVDVTDPDDPLPVICHIDEFTSGETPIFRLEHRFDIPHQISKINDVNLPPVPTAALMCGRRGQRRLEVTVHIINPDDKVIYGYGVSHTTQPQNDYGYLEQGERTAKTDRAIAALGLAICAGDGHIDKRETQAIKRYFAAQFTGLEDEDVAERKERLNEAMRELLADAKENLSQLSLASAAEEVRQRARVVAEMGSEQLNHAAFQLAMQIVAADDQVDEAELAMIKIIAQELEIPAELDQEMRDRYLKLAMFDNEDRAVALNMPEAMTPEEEKAFLNSEYDKWRRRATHKDPKVREEANARLAAVTRARRELETRQQQPPDA